MFSQSNYVAALGQMLENPWAQHKSDYYEWSWTSPQEVQKPFNFRQKSTALTEVACSGLPKQDAPIKSNINAHTHTRLYMIVHIQ